MTFVLTPQSAIANHSLLNSKSTASRKMAKRAESIVRRSVDVRAKQPYIAHMSWFAFFAIILVTFLAMEGLAWWSHKYVMHGFGWAWHRDHHEPHDNILEKNDLYAVVGAVMSMSMFAISSPLVVGEAAWAPGIPIGLGIMLYGAVYTLVHDGLVHQRYFRWVPKSGYAKRLVQAHKLHHATIGKEGGVSFGFIFARDPATLKSELKKQREAGTAVLRDAAV